MERLRNRSSTSSADLESSVHGSVGDIQKSQLNHLVRQSDGGTLFHRYGWLAAAEEGLDGEPRHVLTTKDGNPVGFLPNFATDLSLPSDVGDAVADHLSLEMVAPPPPGYGGPIVTGDRWENANRLFDTAHLTDGLATLFHRVHTFDTDAVGYGRYLEARGYTPRLAQCVFFLDLRDDWETIRENMDSSRRRAIRKAVDQDHDVEILGLGDDLDATYEAYVGNMERIDGTILPKSFFRALADRIPDRVLVFRATVDGREVGRYVHLLDDESSVLHHWLSAIPDSDDFEYYPSELLHQRAIRWGCERAYERYSFGPTKPHFTDSIFKFKAKYGAAPVPALRWERGTLPVAWDLYDLGRSWYRRTQVDA